MKNTAALALTSLACLFGGAPAQAKPAQKGCILIHVSSPHAGAGYNHVATAENRCSSAVQCELWTDVDPEPRYVLELEPQASKDVTFRREAPGYEFRAYYRCRYR